MGTEVLQPQDLLVDRFHVSPASFYRRRNFPANGNLTDLIVNRRPIYHAGYKRASPKPDKKKFNETKKVTHGEARRKDDRSSPTIGPVTALRRSESLDSLTAKINGVSSNLKSRQLKPVDDLAIFGAGRIGPNSPAMLPKQIRLSPPPTYDAYAGSAFYLSPSPRSLPLPSFFNKKQQDDDISSPFEHPATKDLRRLLRLD